jgi:hypothetical protein
MASPDLQEGDDKTEENRLSFKRATLSTAGFKGKAQLW